MQASQIDPETKQAVRAFIEKITLQYDLFGVILFGSRARHTHRADSDADVAVLLKGTPGNFIETRFALIDIAYDVLLDTGILIQPLPIWKTEWDHPANYRNPQLIENIHREGISL